MNPLPVICPECGSWDVEPVGSTRLRFFKSRILHRCGDCGWQGDIAVKRQVPVAVWIIAAITLLCLALLAIDWGSGL